jgi:hypothetical protein
MTAAVDTAHEAAALYRARTTPELVEVPPLAFLMIDGHGDPNTSTLFQESVRALYAVSYALKFAVRRDGGPAYRVGPLEGLWWAADLSSFAIEDKTAYDWTLMIRQPAAVTPLLAAETAAAVAEKKQLPPARELRLQQLTEGTAAQILHLGPYAAEEPTIERLHAFIAERGCRLRGKHHEIYLGDPRRAAPERLRTIIRQPVVAP